MKIRRFKKYLGLCQCKGCLSFYDTIVAAYDCKGRFYPVKACAHHSCSLIAFPYLEN